MGTPDSKNDIMNSCRLNFLPRRKAITEANVMQIRGFYASDGAMQFPNVQLFEAGVIAISCQAVMMW